MKHALALRALRASSHDLSVSQTAGPPWRCAVFRPLYGRHSSPSRAMEASQLRSCKRTNKRGTHQSRMHVDRAHSLHSSARSLHCPSLATCSPHCSATDCHCSALLPHSTAASILVHLPDAAAASASIGIRCTSLTLVFRAMSSNQQSHAQSDCGQRYKGHATAHEVIEREQLPGQLTNTVILITGATSGLGLEMARVLHYAGAHLFLAVRDLAKGRAVKSYIAGSGLEGRGEVDLLHVDLESLDSVRLCAAQFLSKSKQLNVLICKRWRAGSHGREDRGRPRDDVRRQPRGALPAVPAAEGRAAVVVHAVVQQSCSDTFFLRSLRITDRFG